MDQRFWKTEAAFFAWLRGGLRRGIWEKNPIKLQFIQDSRIRIAGVREGTTRWGFKCERCGEIFPANSKKRNKINMHVDHTDGNVSLKSWEDVPTFVKHLATPRQLRILCLDCHELKTHIDRFGGDEKSAEVEKEAIKICKKTKQEVMDFLTENCYNGPTANAKQRREAVTQILKQKQKEETV